jgi:hypothetical protein
MFAGLAGEDTPQLTVYSVEGFLARIGPTAQAGGREEKELWRKVDRFGNIAHVLSAYELRFRSETGDSITRRGINSVQLFFEGGDWVIVSLLWDVERPDSPLPGAFEPGSSGKL